MEEFHEKSDRKQIPIRQTQSLQRILTVRTGRIPNNAQSGKVIASFGKTYLVEYEKSGELETQECFLSGKVITPHTNSNVVAVGDEVSFIRSDRESSASIIKVEQRNTVLSRTAVGKSPTEHVLASNINYEVIVQSVMFPSYNRRLIDRLLIAAELGSIKPVILVNKIDLFDDDDFRLDFEPYTQMGVPVFFLSAHSGACFDQFEEFIIGKSSVFTGPSGSGKSTILNRLLGTDYQSVGKISLRTTKGRHTTSSVRMLKLPSGGCIIDTPGIREFGLWGIIKDELHLYFHDFEETARNCKYDPCTHTHEPDCAVPQAVENDIIDPQRYESYLSLFESIDK